LTNLTKNTNPVIIINPSIIVKTKIIATTLLKKYSKTSVRKGVNPINIP
jgi:hypothetical protein